MARIPAGGARVPVTQDRPRERNVFAEETQTVSYAMPLLSGTALRVGGFRL
jgi:hypothetical protein